MWWKTSDGGWDPYLAGALAGVLAIGSALVTTKAIGRTQYLGASTTFVRLAGLIQKPLADEHVTASEYYAKTKLKVDWQFMLVLGIFLGALIASLGDKSYKLEGVPPTWAERFGPSVGKRAGAAILGGIVAMVGARMADGCPSGHGLSGMMQLSVSSFVALAFFFGTGVVVARLVYGGRKNG